MTIPLLSSLIGLGKRDALRVLIRQYIWYPLFPRMSLISRGIAHEFIELYDGLQLQNVDSKADYFGFGLIHYSLVTNIKPKRILCIGSKKGFIPAVCALACRDNRFGTVDFVVAVS